MAGEHDRPGARGAPGVRDDPGDACGSLGVDSPPGRRWPSSSHVRSRCSRQSGTAPARAAARAGRRPSRYRYRPARQRLDGLPRPRIGARADGRDGLACQVESETVGGRTPRRRERPLVLLEQRIPGGTGSAWRTSRIVTGGGEHRVCLRLELLDHRRVAQGGGVAQLVALGDVLQQPPHDLARAGLGQVVTMITAFGRAILPIFSPIHSRSSAASSSLGS